jgi:circadian clock protein KaiC
MVEGNGRRHRVLYVLKSRGMPHSHDIRNFVLSKEGLLVDDVHHAAGMPV